MPENTPGSRDANVNPVAEQAPHSGVHGYEQPVYDFNGQTLQEALDSGALHIEYDENGRPKVIVPDTLGDHVDPTQSTKTEVHEPFLVPEEKKSKRRIAAIAAGALGAAIIGGLGAVKMFGSDETSPTPRDEQATSATPNPGEQTASPEEGDSSVSPIEGVNHKSTAAEIQYVIDHPVTISEYPTAEEALAAIGQRHNVVLNSMEPDFDAPIGSYALTAESEALVDQMSATYLNPASPGYAMITQARLERGTQIGAMFTLNPSAETQYNLVATTSAPTPLEAGKLYTLPADAIFTTNQPDTTSGDGRYNDDYHAEYTLQVSESGQVMLYSVENSTDIGNIG